MREPIPLGTPSIKQQNQRLAVMQVFFFAQLTQELHKFGFEIARFKASVRF
jgi:hypothetical protein